MLHLCFFKRILLFTCHHKDCWVSECICFFISVLKINLGKCKVILFHINLNIVLHISPLFLRLEEFVVPCSPSLLKKMFYYENFQNMPQLGEEIIMDTHILIRSSVDSLIFFAFSLSLLQYSETNFRPYVISSLHT